MEVTIKFKPQAKPEEDLVSFSLEDVRVKDLGAVLGRLPETLAKSYANTIAFQRSKDEDTCKKVEQFILSQSKRE